jgi:hypothetical protein
LVAAELLDGLFGADHWLTVKELMTKDDFGSERADSSSRLAGVYRNLLARQTAGQKGGATSDWASFRPIVECLIGRADCIPRDLLLLAASQQLPRAESVLGRLGSIVRISPYAPDSGKLDTALPGPSASIFHRSFAQWLASQATSFPSI